MASRTSCVAQVAVGQRVLGDGGAGLVHRRRVGEELRRAPSRSSKATSAAASGKRGSPAWCARTCRTVVGCLAADGVRGPHARPPAGRARGRRRPPRSARSARRTAWRTSRSSRGCRRSRARRRRAVPTSRASSSTSPSRTTQGAAGTQARSRARRGAAGGCGSPADHRRHNGAMSEPQSNAARIREINDSIRYTMWSVFRLDDVLGDEQPTGPPRAPRSRSCSPSWPSPTSSSGASTTSAGCARTPT